MQEKRAVAYRNSTSSTGKAKGEARKKHSRRY